MQIDVLSCFKLEHIFHTLEHGNLRRDFTANFAYIFSSFRSCAFYRYSKHLKIFGNRDFCVFTIKLRCDLRLSHNDCWYFVVFFKIPFPSSHMSTRAGPLLLVSSILRGLFVGINYPRIVCIGRQTAVFNDMDEIAHEYLEYQRTQDASLWKSC